jgi:predicted protein tyrosine phosphatase
MQTASGGDEHLSLMDFHARALHARWRGHQAPLSARTAVLVHCGAGVSRSAALVIAYLMRRFTWPAERAREHCRARRSLVNPNQGFWRQLCAFEAQLGITQRCAHAARPIVLL